MRQVVSMPAIVVVTLLLAGTSGVLADVRLPAVIGDNMVLQQGSKAPVWGWAEAGEEVAKPVAVRFGWHQIAEPNLSNKEGLPASPFRTDKW